MKHISIIVPSGKAIISSITGTFEIFNKVNDYLIESGISNVKAFDVGLLGIEHEQKQCDGIFTINHSRTIYDVEKTDLIILTAIDGDIDESIQRNEELISWVRNQRINHGSEIASLCLGAFLLAETGLLNGKQCSTHWMAADYFRKKYSKINLVEEKVITEDNGIYTSGGAFSFLNLIVHLVEKHCGREAAIWCSKVFEIDFERANQNHFAIFNPQKKHEDDLIIKAQNYIEDNYHEKICIEELAEIHAFSRRNFVRRFKKATANTPRDYIQRVKIEAAKRSLETSTHNINDVMFSVGYNDIKAFRVIFKRYTGLSPSEYRKKYNREMAAM